MMKRMALLALVALAPLGLAQGSDRGAARLAVGSKTFSIDYGRPGLKGRDMLGQSQVGLAWRMGADAATSLKTEADLAFGAVNVPKGEYILTATKVAADTWHLNVLAKADRAKVAEIPLTQGTLPQSVEMFTIALKGEKEKGEFEMHWGTTALKAAFTGK